MSQRSLQFDLRTLGILIFCVSVGLSACIPPSYGDIGWLKLLESLPWIFSEVLLIACAVAMVIGIIQELSMLKQARLTWTATPAGFSFAKFWRIAIAILLAILLIRKTGLNRGFFVLPGEESSLFPMIVTTAVIPELLIIGCMLIVLTSELGRYQTAPRKKQQLLFCILVGLAVSAGMFVLSQSNRIVYLVYVALEGVEKTEPAMFKRPGAYPNFLANGHWLFWCNFVAVIFAAIGTTSLLLVFSAHERIRNRRTILFWGGLFFLSCSAAFGYWFGLVKYPTIAPDFAEAGLASDWRQWIEAAMLLMLAFPVAAYRLAADRSQILKVRQITELSDTQRRPPLHQSGLVLLMLGMASISYFLSLLLQISLQFFFGVSYPGITRWDIFLWNISDINIYILMSIPLLSLHLCWKYWKAPVPIPPILITPVSTTKFLFALLSLFLILVLALPSIAAYSLVFWFNPWM